MSQPSPESAADPERLVDRLPSPPEPWERSHDGGGIVEYRLAGDDGVCAAAKLVVRPDLLGDSAVRIDRKQGCQSAGTTRHEDVASAVDALGTELDAATDERRGS